MDPINLGIKFVKGWEPTPDVPGTDVVDATAQTGDFMGIAIFVLLALIAVGIACFLYVRNRKLVSVNQALRSNISFEVNLSVKTKVAILGAVVTAAICTIFACFSVSAFAANEASPLVIDKNELTATVGEDGTFTLDTCTMTNKGDKKYTIDASSVSVTDEFSETEKDALRETDVQIDGFEGILFSGKARGVDYNPKDLTALDASKSTQLTFKIEFNERVKIDTLFDKTVFNISLTPIEYVDIFRIDFKDVNGCDYCPVFAPGDLENITFYDSNDNPVKNEDGQNIMSEKICYAISPYSTKIKAVRSLNNVSFDDLYPEDPKTEGVKTFNYDSDWAKDNLVFSSSNNALCLEKVEPLTDQLNPEESPKIYNVELVDVWYAYNPHPEVERGNPELFGGASGLFWSSIASSSEYAVGWDSFLKSWIKSEITRQYYGDDIFVLISRELSGDAEASDNDITALQEKLEETHAYSEEYYSPELWSAFQYAIKQAHAALDEASPKQAFVRSATSQLKKAINNLKATMKKVEFKGVDGFNYYPIFNTMPGGVVFYNESESKVYYEMNYEINHAFVATDTTFNTVRSIAGKKWEQVFAFSNETSTYPQEADIHAENYRSELGVLECEEVPWVVDKEGKYYPETYSPWLKYDDSTYSLFSISDIWNIYKKAGFGGPTGNFWSSVASSAIDAFDWDCDFEYWTRHDRNGSGHDRHIVVERKFVVTV